MNRLTRIAIPAICKLVATLCLICALYTHVHAQGSSYPGTPIALTRGGFPAAGAAVVVCSGSVTVTLTASPPCTPYATIYRDAAMAIPITQPGFVTDGLGNFPFFVAAGGTYTVVIPTQGGFTGVSHVWTSPIQSNLPNTFSAEQTFDLDLKIKEITAPSGATGYDVLYGDSTANRFKMKNNNGAADVVVGAATTDTLTNKTLTSPTITTPTITSPVINGTPSGTGIQTITLKKGSGGGAYTTSSGTYVDVDGTNLAYTVTIPTGWKLAISASFDVFQSTAAAGMTFSFLDSSTIYENLTSPILGNSSNVSMAWVVNGDGASHTIKLQYKTSNVADAANIRNSSATLLPVMVFILSPSN